jgi:hypothetical protein
VKAQKAITILTRAKNSGNNMEAFRHHYMENRLLFDNVRLRLEADQEENQHFRDLCSDLKDKVSYCKHVTP